MAKPGDTAHLTDCGWICNTCGFEVFGGCSCPHGEWQCLDCGEWTYPFYYDYKDGCQWCGSLKVGLPYEKNNP